MSPLAPTEAFVERTLEGRRIAESGDFLGAEAHFRTLLNEARDRHAGNHVLAMKSLLTVFGRSGRYLEAHMLAQRIARTAREFGPSADRDLAFALSSISGALSHLELHEPLGRALCELREVLDRLPEPSIESELKYRAAASAHARGRGDLVAARHHQETYEQLVREADVEAVFRWSLTMSRAQLAHAEGDFVAARRIATEFGKGHASPPFHRLKELVVTVGAAAQLGDAEDARAAAHEAMAILESVRGQSELASGRIHEGSLLAHDLETMGELELATRTYDLVAAAVLIRLRQVDECTRELPELGLADDESHAVLAQFRQQFVDSQRELLSRVAQLLESRGDAYVHALLERSAPDGMVALCAWCESVRPSDGRWLPLGHYIPRESHLDLTHTACDPCAEKVHASWAVAS